MNDELDFSLNAANAEKPRFAPYSTPNDWNDSDFYFEEREPEEGGPPYGRAKAREIVPAAARFLFGQFWFFAATFAAAFLFFAVAWSETIRLTDQWFLYWTALGAAGAPFSLLGRKLAFRLAKTGSIRRRVDSAEPRYFSARYLGVGFLCSALLTGGFFGALGLLTRLLSRFFFLSYVQAETVAFAPAFYFATSFAFFPFFLAEYKLSVFKAFRWSSRYLRKAVPFLAGTLLSSIFAFVLAAFFVGMPFVFGESRLLAAASAALYVAFSAAAPVASLLSTGRRLYCEKERLESNR